MNQHNKVTSRHIPQPESPTIIEETPKSQLPTPTVGKIGIIPKTMFIELGNYDRSSGYTVNYSDSETIGLYQKLTEKRIDIEPLLPTNIQPTH